MRALISVNVIISICFVCSNVHSLCGQCTPVQLHKLVPDDSVAGDIFGRSVGISDTIAIVAAYQDDDNGEDSGSVYLFDLKTGKQLYKLLPDDGEAGDFFGFHVAISGNTAVIGATGDDDNGENAGAAYLFDVNTGQQIHKLLPDDGAEGDEFGRSVGIDGSIATVSAWRDDDNGDGSGSAYLFNTTTGKQIAKLLPDDGAEFDSFGSTHTVGVSGLTTVVGCRQDDDNGTGSGSAYLFDTMNGGQIYKLLPEDGAEFDGFGTAGIDAATAIIGAQGNGVSGSAYLFDAASGQQIFKLSPDDGAEGDGFGFSVAISGEIAVVGSRGDDDNGDDSGSAYLFDVNTGEQVSKLLPDDGAAGDDFGFHVAINGNYAIVGAPDALPSGSAYLFDIGSCVVDLGDVNGDGEVNLLDVQPFVDLLTSGGFQSEADINQDGVVNLLDVAPFVELLTG